MNDSELSKVVRAFIALHGIEAAHRMFSDGPQTGPKPLSLERVRGVAAGNMDPTFHMAEVAYARLPQVASAGHAVNPETVAYSPAPVQPWVRAAEIANPIPVQPWATAQR